MKQTRIIAHAAPWADAIDLYVVREDLAVRPVPVEALMVVSPGLLAYEPIDEGSLPPATPFRITRQAAQRLMDGLYYAGIRPSDSSTAGQVEAMKYHLEDMRRMVFGEPK